MASEAKIAKTDHSGDSNGKMDQVKSIQMAIEQIDSVQSNIDLLNEQASEEILKVEQTFNKKRQPFYQKRAVIIETIAGFWLTVLKNHPQLSEVISPEDTAVLNHLINVDVQEFDDIKSGYKITLHFSPNEFFKNTSITKEFHITEPRQYSQCEKVDWVPGKNFTETNKKVDQANKRSVPLESFMTWFVSDNNISMDEKGEVLKDDIWPNPLQYYLANEDELDGHDDEDDLEDDEEDDEDLCDEEEDDEIDEEDEDGE